MEVLFLLFNNNKNRNNSYVINIKHISPNKINVKRENIIIMLKVLITMVLFLSQVNNMSYVHKLVHFLMVKNVFNVNTLIIIHLVVINVNNVNSN